MEEASKKRPNWKRRITLGVVAMVILLILALLTYAALFGPVDQFGKQEEFVVKPDATVDQVVESLKEQGLVKSPLAFRIAYLRYDKGTGIRPGGYELSKSMDAWSLAEALGRPPYLVWVTLRAGMRKEQIAEALAKQLGWSESEKQEWLTKDTAPTLSYTEGVYYPDTYLIPSDMTPAQVADMLRKRFQEIFAPYAAQAAEKNMRWTDVLTLASIIEREAAKNDKPLVAGILLNRLEVGMPLAVDATLQYIRGTKENGWWPTPTGADKYLVSPFNTYKHVGLPPHPIAEPSLQSVAAVLNAVQTDCLFYIHDNNGQIHCSKTYAGQKDNVNRYLK